MGALRAVVYGSAFALLLLVTLLMASGGAVAEEDEILLFGRPLESREVFYVGEHGFELYVVFHVEWANYSMELESGLDNDRHVTWYDYAGPWYPGNHTSFYFKFHYHAPPGLYNGTLFINRTRPDGTFDNVTMDLVIDYREVLAIRDVYLVRGSDTSLRIEVVVLLDCESLDVWLEPMAHHDAETEEWSVAPCPAGVYVFETPLPGGRTFPGGPPKDTCVVAWTRFDGRLIEVDAEPYELRIEYVDVGTTWLTVVFLLSFSSVALVALSVLRGRRRQGDGGSPRE